MRTVSLLFVNICFFAAIQLTHAKKWSTNKDSIIIEADNDDGIFADETIEKIECRTVDSEIGQCVTVRRCHPILFTDDGAIRNKELAETFATTDASCVTEVSPKTSAADIGDRTICCAVSKLLSSLRTGLDEELDLYPTTVEPIFNDQPQSVEDLPAVSTVDSLILEDNAIVLEDEPVQTTVAPNSIILSHLLHDAPTSFPAILADEPVQTTSTPLVNHIVHDDADTIASQSVVIESLIANSADDENTLDDAPAAIPIETTTFRTEVKQEDEPVVTTQATVVAEKFSDQEVPVQDEAIVPTTVREELQDEVVTTSAPVVVKEVEDTRVADETEVPEVQTTTVQPVAQTELPAPVSDEAQTDNQSGIPSLVNQSELGENPTTVPPLSPSQPEAIISQTTTVPEVEIPVESQTGISFPSTSVEPETTAHYRPTVPVAPEGSVISESEVSPSSDSSDEPEIINPSQSPAEVSPSDTSDEPEVISPSQSPQQEVSPSSSSSVAPEVITSSQSPPEATPSSDASAETEVISSSQSPPEISSSSVVPELPVVEVSSETPAHSEEPKPEIPISSSPVPEIPVINEEDSNPVPDRPFDSCPNVASYHQWPVFHNYPFLASILTRSKTGPLCSGSLIDSRHVLTAAHCLHRFNSRDVAGMQVRLGFSKYNGNDTLEHHYIERRASKVILHKHFHAQNKMDNNIALVQLNKPVVFDEHVNPINIFREVPGYNEGNCSASQAGFIRFGNRIVTEIGDGFINFIEAPMGDFFLRESLSRVYTDNECKTELHSQVTEKMVCAKPEVFEAEGITGIFKGNDGGPLLIKDGNQILQIGIKSWAYEGNQYPTVYTRVDSYFKWIADNLKM